MLPLARLLMAVCLFSACAAVPLQAADTEAPARYNQIHFQAERGRPVDNDRMHATLYVTAEDADAARLADEINRTMDWALKAAKSKTRVQAHTTGYRTYPVKEKLKRWRATQELQLESSDFAELGGLIGQLQERLQVGAIHFSISPERRKVVEDELITQALDAFKQRAELVRRQLAAKSYRLVDLSINTGGGAQPVPMMRGMVLDAMEKSAAPAVEAGTSTLSVNVGGTIELQ